MKTAVVNFKTTPKLKKQIQQIAKKIDVPLSFILNHFLKHIADNDPVDACTIDCIIKSKKQLQTK